MPPRKAPANLPMLAIAIRPSASMSSVRSARMVRSALRPARPKNTGMKNAMIMPRSCSSMWRVRIGDSPISMPATKAPSTVCTPIAWVISAITPMITRMVVITANSLARLSLAQRMASATARRPTVRLTARKTAVPITLFATLARSMPPDCARLNVIAMMIQPIVSSTIADGDDHLAEVAAGEVHLAHDRGDDLDRGDRQRGAEEERRHQPLAGIGQELTRATTRRARRRRRTGRRRRRARR